MICQASLTFFFMAASKIYESILEMMYFLYVSSFLQIALTKKMMHNRPMRTTVTLDQDVYELATLYARGRGMTLSAALSELARKGVSAPPEKSRLVRASNGLLVIPARGRVITSEMVKEALEEDDFA